ncbi:MAG TPA: hypothetical protein VJJ51_13570 [Candidatus Methanoperedens sp.]|nr:hypothetical protein [Candidatus Methanoperedens sp.]HLB72064.1 hypothetical protein [Candidatus Methanoperedens sp.]
MKKGETNNKTKATVKCTICRLPMDCPESLLLADQHFCPKCSRLMDEGYEFKDFMRDPDISAQHYGYSHEVAQEMAEVMFQDHWKKVKEPGKENEALAKEFFYHGATQALGFLISAGMPPWFLDNLEKQIRVVKEIRRGRGSDGNCNTCA